MRKITILLMFIFMSLEGFSQKTSKDDMRILVVVSSYGKDGGELRPGFELDELSQAYWILKDNNIEIDIASPKGGKVEPDEYNAKKPYNKRFLEDEEAMLTLENTLSTSELVDKYYDAVFIMGGKGAMFDLPVDPSLQEIISKIYRANGKISAVCHGAAAFVHVKTDEGFIVHNRKIAGFCNSEEEKFGKKWVNEFPFLLETKLEDRGALYEKGYDMLPFSITENNFVTGQNPYSTTLVTEELLRSLGKEPVVREEYTDVKSMFLVKKALEGEYAWAKNEIAINQSNYDLELIAVYGYYELLHSKENKEITERGLSVIELVTPYFFNENLALETARSYLKVGDLDKARSILNDLIKRDLLSDKAKIMLQEMN